jgi:hypothetical protein
MGGANPVRAECSSLNQSSRDLRSSLAPQKCRVATLPLQASLRVCIDYSRAHHYVLNNAAWPRWGIIHCAGLKETSHGSHQPDRPECED